MDDSVRYTPEKNRMGLTFGAMADSIEAQLDEQGLGGAKDQGASWQRSTDAITWLSIRGLLSPTHVRQARKRLVREIARAVEKELLT